MTRIVQLADLPAQQGRALGPTDWLTMEQERINRFADATDDHQWIHVDPKKAAQGPYGATIAHGYLTLALVNKFLPELLTVEGATMGVNYGCNKVRFPAPVPVGARLRAHGQVDEVAQAGDGWQATITVTLEVEGAEKPACVATTLSRFHP